MNESEFDEFEWLDDELRRAPTPEGLIRRLKLIGEVEDSQIDSVVRDAIAIPEGLFEQLKSIPVDDELDQRLRDVEMPTSLISSLHAISETAPTGDLTDEPVGASLSELSTDASGSMTARRRGLGFFSGGRASRGRPSRASERTSDGIVWVDRLRREPVTMFAAASCLLIAVGLVLFASGLLFGPGEPGNPNELAESNENESTPNNEADPGTLADHSPDTVEPPAALPELPPAAPDQGLATTDDPHIEPGAQPKLKRSPFGLAIEGDPNEAIGIGREPMDDQLVDNANNLAETDPRVSLDRIVGFGGATLRPHVETAGRLGRRGLDPPHSKDFNLLRYLREGVHPFVSPGADAKLRKTRVPIHFDSHSFDLLRETLDQGRLPSSEEIRPEDFLAAVDYQFPRPTFHPVGLIAAGGPSPFATEPMQLLQLGIQTRNQEQRKLPPSELILAVEVTPGVAGERRLELLRRTLSQLPKWFERGDRVTVVPLLAKGRPLIDRAGQADQADWHEAIARLRTDASSDLEGGLTHAVALATRDDSYAWRRNVVVVLGDLDDYNANELASLEQAMQTGAGNRIQWDLVHLDGLPREDTKQPSGSTPPELKQVSPHHRLAETAGGRLHRVDNSSNALSALATILSGNSRLVAKKASLTIHFNPATVARYRLIGHEASQAGGLISPEKSPASLEVDLQSGQSATALFELQLRRTGGDEVARAEFSWNDAKTGKANRTIQRISRLQFAPSKYESALSLQMAAIVSESAEVLRGSPYSESHRRALAKILAETEHVSPRLRSNRSFVEFLTVIQQASQRRVGAATTDTAPIDWLPRAR